MIVVVSAITCIMFQRAKRTVPDDSVMAMVMAIVISSKTSHPISYSIEWGRNDVVP